MPSNKRVNTTEGLRPLATAQRKTQKAPGTRVGVMEDWRQAGASGKAPQRNANALRDGR